MWLGACFGLAFFCLIVTWRCVLPTQCKAGWSTSWQAGPRFSGTGNFALGKLTLEILSDLRKQTNQLASWPLLAPSPALVSCTELVSLVLFLIFLPCTSTKRNKIIMYILLLSLFRLLLLILLHYQYVFFVSLYVIFCTLSYFLFLLLFCPQGPSYTHSLGSWVTSQR